MSGAPARFGWALFDWAQQPYYTLIGSFIFRPYFVAAVAVTPAIGQVQIGLSGAVAGLIVAVTGPVIGMALDHGSLKGWLAWTSLPFVLACAGLWWALPGGGASILLALTCLTVAAVMAEITTTVNNAMMPAIAGAGRMGRLSGYGVALGAAGGVASAAVMSAAFLSPDIPLLGLDKAMHEPERFVGPFSALWYGLFLIPLFLTYPSTTRAPRRGRPLHELGALLRTLPRNRPMFHFMIGRMLVADATAAVQIFGGIIALTLFHWPPAQLATFGMLVLAAGALGAMLGGHIDDRASPKLSVLITCAALALSLAGIGSTAADHILFFIPVDPFVSGEGYFSSTSERVFIAFALLLALATGPLVGSMRTWMAELAPPGEEGRWFGLYAVAGRATAFAAPLAVSLATLATGEILSAIPVILAFLLAGAFAFRLVPAPDARAGGG